MNDIPGTELAVAEERPEPIVRVPLTAGATPRPLVPIDFDGAYRIANVVVRAGMAPKTLNSVEKAMVAILHGLEVGLTPMNALQSIAVINGRPTIWGDGAIGLIRASGLLEYMHERFEGEGPNLTAVCIVKRKGEPKEVRGEFSWSDVLRAHLNTKDGPWQTYPRRMMQMRARWPLRDVFADVLKGLALKEEVEDMERQDVAQVTHQPQPQPERRRVPSPPPEEGKQPEAAQAPAKAAASEQPSDGFPGNVAAPAKKDDPISTGPAGGFPGDKPMPTISDPERLWLESLENAFSGCEDSDSLAAAQSKHMTPMRGEFSDAAWNKAVDIIRSHLKRVIA